MLSDAKVKRAKATDKPLKMADGHGLTLYVTPAGGKIWRLRYRIDGKEQQLVLGQYPLMSLAEARDARDDARKILATGGNPAVDRKAKAQAQVDDSGNTFEKIAREWHALNLPKWTEKHGADVLVTLERDVFPAIGAIPIKDITPVALLEALRAVEERGAIETARRLRQRCSAVFGYAIATGRGSNDPAAQIEKAMAPLPPKGRQPAIVESFEKVREIIMRVDETPAHPVTKLAHRLLALTVVRPGTLITTPWSEFENLAETDPTWVVPAARMKLLKGHKHDEARDHFVPLTPHAIEIIDSLRKLTGRGPYVFPNGRHFHKVMSENAIGYLLNRAGYHHKHVPHGWRAAFSSLMNEQRPRDRLIIDMALAHTSKGSVEAAYNRAQHLKLRREIMTEWADNLVVGLMPLEQVVKMPRRA